MFSLFNSKYYHFILNVVFLVWSYPLIAIVTWNNKLNLQTSAIDSSLHFYNFYFNSFIYKMNSWTRWFLKFSQLEHSMCFKLMENSVLPKHRKQFSGSNTCFQNFKPNSYRHKILHRVLHLTTWVKGTSISKCNKLSL